MKNLGWAVLAGSAARICFHFPEIIVWALFAAILYVTFVRPFRTFFGNSNNEEE
ncbi:MAG: hypothetical protein IJC27_07620 [Lentisphaeria bacterium]|nr:hypothetical protein [Lentisphaeria bacterium]